MTNLYDVIQYHEQMGHPDMVELLRDVIDFLQSVQEELDNGRFTEGGDGPYWLEGELRRVAPWAKTGHGEADAL